MVADAVVDDDRSRSGLSGSGLSRSGGERERADRRSPAGEGSAFTVDLPSPEGSFGIGSRLLVSGESRWGDPELADAIACPCGFTRYYDAEPAQAWKDAY